MSTVQALINKTYLIYIKGNTITTLKNYIKLIKNRQNKYCISVAFNVPSTSLYIYKDYPNNGLGNFDMDRQLI